MAEQIIVLLYVTGPITRMLRGDHTVDITLPEIVMVYLDKVAHSR